jgi:hypothetical protein
MGKRAHRSRALSNRCAVTIRREDGVQRGEEEAVRKEAQIVEVDVKF